MPAAAALKERAEENYESTCDVDFPPGVCSSDNLFDFLTLGEMQGLLQSAGTRTAVQQEGQNFAVAADPQAELATEFITVSFPHEYPGGRQMAARVVITEPQTEWLGNLLRPEHYSISVEAESFLSLEA